MKKYISIAFAALFLIIAGCGDNIKDKIPSLTMPVTVESDFASTMRGVYISNDISTDIFLVLGPLGSLGMGVGSSSIQGSGLKACDFGEAMTELGEPDPTGGHYTRVIDEPPTSGIAKIYFLSDCDLGTVPSNIIHLDVDWLFDSSTPFYIYDSPSILSVKTDIREALAQSSVYFKGYKYMPGPWRRFQDGEPPSTGWLALEASDFDPIGNYAKINSFITTSLVSYDGMTVVIDMTQPGKTMHVVFTVDLPDGSFTPTDATPSHQTGYGTINFDDGTVLTIENYDMMIGTDGPLSGTITCTRNNGYSTKMEYKADRSVDGEIYKDGSSIATFHINPNGTGYYKDTSGKSYPIT